MFGQHTSGPDKDVAGLRIFVLVTQAGYRIIGTADENSVPLLAFEFRPFTTWVLT